MITRQLSGERTTQLNSAQDRLLQEKAVEHPESRYRARHSDLHLWLLDGDRRDALVSIWKEQKEVNVSAQIFKEMEALGLCEWFSGHGRALTKKGKLLAYNIEEFRIQVESGKILDLLKVLNIFPGSVVLDLGCGGGQTLFALADKNPSLALGMDFDFGHLEIAKALSSSFPLKNGRFAFQQGDGNELPFRDESVDVLICRGVLHYLEINQALSEMVRVLKPGGRVYIHALGLGSFVSQALKPDLAGQLLGLFGIFNGFFFSLTGKQIAVNYKNHVVRGVFLSAKTLRTLNKMGVRINRLERVPYRCFAGYHVLVGEKV